MPIYVNSEYDIEKAFRAVEDELIHSMIRNLKGHRAEENKEGFNWSAWQTEQLKALEKYKKANSEKFKSRFSDINDSVDDLLREARSAGGTAQEQQILKAIKDGFKAAKAPKQGAEAAFFKLNSRKLNALIKATRQDFEKAEYAMLRMANDKYRQIIFNAQVYANTGAGTYEKAVDMATRDFLGAGINCIEYKNGSRHTVKEYARMAIQTAGKRAYLTGEGEKRKEWGISTVIVKKRGNACPKCLPFCGKVLIDDVWSGGVSDGKHRLMSEAIAAGLYHPNCKDIHTTYFEGITEYGEPYTKEELKQIEEDYKKEQEQQYAKRQVERFERLAKYSLDEDNKKLYAARKEQWERLRFKTGTPNTDDYVEEKKLKAFFGNPLDITKEWKTVEQKVSEIEDMLEYTIDGKIYNVDGKKVLLDYSTHEKNIAQLIAKETGKKVKMVPRITYPQGIQTPDYLINDARFDLKTPLGNGKNTLYGMVKSKKRQANNFVICADKTELSIEELKRQILDIYRSKNTSFVDMIILIKDNKIINVYKRNK